MTFSAGLIVFLLLTVLYENTCIIIVFCRVRMECLPILRPFFVFFFCTVSILLRSVSCFRQRTRLHPCFQQDGFFMFEFCLNGIYLIGLWGNEIKRNENLYNQKIPNEHFMQNIISAFIISLFIIFRSIISSFPLFFRKRY